MSREASIRPQQIQDDLLWVATLTVPTFSQSIAFQHKTQTMGVVAGDPIFIDQHRAPTAAQSSKAVFDVLANQQITQLTHTRGMFCAMAWNAPERCLTLATDKLANRCLYFKDNGKKLVFSTSLRLLRVLSDDAEKVDEQGLAEQLFFGQPMADRTLFDGIKVLGPGQALMLQAGQPPQIFTYSDYTTVPRVKLSMAEAAAQLHDRFSDAVRRRMPNSEQEAFLSGGMDSRAVVAELVDQGHTVRTFCAAYPDSIDDLVSADVAKAFGAAHTIWHRSPADRILVALDPFAIYARENFPTLDGRSTARTVWSGDGGSVTLGHVYMSARSVELAGHTPTMAGMFALFPNLRARPTRQIGSRKIQQLAELAAAGAMNELARCGGADPDRRLFHFYMRNDQARHLYHHFESIDLSQIELLTPFFDADFVDLVAALPTDYFLGHKLYNQWITGFKCNAGCIYWQPYRGHLPGPHPNPYQAGDQWDNSWYTGAAISRAYTKLAGQLCGRRDGLVQPYLKRGILRACQLLSRFGISKYNYEIAYARNMLHQLGNPA